MTQRRAGAPDEVCCQGAIVEGKGRAGDNKKQSRLTLLSSSSSSFPLILPPSFSCSLLPPPDDRSYVLLLLQTIDPMSSSSSLRSPDTKDGWEVPKQNGAHSIFYFLFFCRVCVLLLLLLLFSSGVLLSREPHHLVGVIVGVLGCPHSVGLDVTYSAICSNVDVPRGQHYIVTTAVSLAWRSTLHRHSNGLSSLEVNITSSHQWSL